MDTNLPSDLESIIFAVNCVRGQNLASEYPQAVEVAKTMHGAGVSSEEIQETLRGCYDSDHKWIGIEWERCIESHQDKKLEAKHRVAEATGGIPMTTNVWKLGNARVKNIQEKSLEVPE